MGLFTRDSNKPPLRSVGTMWLGKGSLGASGPGICDRGNTKQPGQTLPCSTHLFPQDPPIMVPITLHVWTMPYISRAHILKHTELRRCNSHICRHGHRHIRSEHTMTQLGVNSHTHIYTKIYRDSLVFTLISQLHKAYTATQEPQTHP